jgi:hypothetical protein
MCYYEIIYRKALTVHRKTIGGVKIHVENYVEALGIVELHAEQFWTHQ